MIKIGIGVTEPSADKISAMIANNLYKKEQNIEISGLTGINLEKTKCLSLGNIKNISVIGFTDVLKKLPQLLFLRHQIIKKYINNKIDLFVGFDGPDFNINIEKKLRKKGIKTVHFISPSIWAWRSYRIKKIKRSIDLMLCVFPFELDFYKKHNIEAKFVGHPMADILQPREIILKENNLIALLPGSRKSEIKRILPILINSAEIINKDNNYKFTIALHDTSLLAWCQKIISKKKLNIDIAIAQTYEVLRQAKLAIVTSGTATLEAALIGVPMIVVYKMSFINYAIISSLVHTQYYSLPNIIANKLLVPELIQANANANSISHVAKILLSQSHENLIQEFMDIHKKLKQNCAQTTADILLNICSTQLKK